MNNYNDVYRAVKTAFPEYKVDPSFGSISVVNKLQSISFGVRSDGDIAVQSSVSGLEIDMKIWEQFKEVPKAIEFALSLVIKPEDQPIVDLAAETSDFVLDGEGETELPDPEIVSTPLVVTPTVAAA